MNFYLKTFLFIVLTFTSKLMASSDDLEKDGQSVVLTLKSEDIKNTIHRANRRDIEAQDQLIQNYKILSKKQRKAIHFQAIVDF